MRIVFFGTSKFSTKIFSQLFQEGLQVVGVVTQPDKPKGRGKTLLPPDLKKYVVEHCSEIPIFQFQKASNPDAIEKISSLKPDLFIVASFGQILKQVLLDVPTIDSINVHTSLLPEYRGAAPIQRAIMDGKKETGVTIMRMVLKLDAGNILAKKQVPIDPDLTYGELEERLADVGNALLIHVLKTMKGAPIEGIVQNEAEVTFAPKIDPEECEIDWSEPIQKIHDKIRALSPKPGAWSWVSIDGEKKKVKILRSKIFTDSSTKNRWLVSGKSGTIELQKIQPEGKRAMCGADFLRGCRGIVSIYGSNR